MLQKAEYPVAYFGENVETVFYCLMKILFDHQIFSSQTFGGISRYHIQLIKHLGIEWELPLFCSNNFYLKEVMTVPGFFRHSDFRGKNRILERLNRIKAVSAIRKGDFDIFHPTFYESYSLVHLKNRPMVLTLHDMTHDRFSELPAAQWEKKEKYIMAHRANAIIVPSQFTADELMELYHIPANKIQVVWHGGPEWEVTAVPQTENRFLFVGTRAYYKNFAVVLEALKMVPDATLLIAGSPLTRTESMLIESLGIRERVKTVNPSDDELKKIYASSAALIFPSLMEGFGLPVLEAFAANCPVICSDIPVFREVGGEAALYFPPDSPAALADAMKANMAHRFTENIARQREKFSWKKCAAETLCVYENVLQSC